MISVDIKALLSRLNPLCATAMEGAAGLCVSRTHYEVTVEHFLSRLLEESQSDLVPIFRQFDLDPAKVKRTVDQVIEEFRTGNAARPVLSPLLLEWIQEAWLVASVDLGEGRIRSGALLLALLTRSAQFSEGRHMDLLRTIGRESLLSQFGTIVRTSPENAPPAEKMMAEGGPPAATSALGRFCTDFTSKARAGQIDPVFGRDREIRQSSFNWSTFSKNSENSSPW